jgi:serine protease Do
MCEDGHTLPDPDRRRLLVGLAGLALTGCAAGRPATPDFSALVARHADAVLSIARDGVALGSAFAIEGTRTVVTAAHVLRSGSGPLELRTAQGPRAATPILVDEEADLALLQAELPAGQPRLVLAAPTEEPAVGAWILVLGNPFGAGVTATFGIVSARPGAIAARADLARRLQINASVNPGNSGGPVLDLAGRVIGVASAKLPAGAGLAFAVPVADLRALLQRAAS